eukprot:15275884-Alexandrium_andersonii.AAC.1
MIHSASGQWWVRFSWRDHGISLPNALWQQLRASTYGAFQCSVNPTLRGCASLNLGGRLLARFFFAAAGRGC